MAFVIGLPKGAQNRRYSVRSRKGGLPLQDTVALLSKTLNFLDLNVKIDGVEIKSDDDVEIYDDDQTEFNSLLRVYLAQASVMLDAQREFVLQVESATAEFLDLDGRATGRLVGLHLFINTEVTQEGTPAGELWMWPQTDVPSEVDTGEQGE